MTTDTALPAGYTTRPQSDGTLAVLTSDRHVAGHIKPDRLGRPLPHDYTGHPMQAFPRLETWTQAAHRIAAAHQAHLGRLPHHHAQARRSIEDVADDASARAHHIATTATNPEPHPDGTTWHLSEATREQHAAFIARNPDRGNFITAQTGGRDAALAAGSGQVDLLTEHLRVGDYLWAPAAPQIHPYGWREIIAIHPFDHGNGARITVRTSKGPIPHMDLHLERSHTVLVRR